MSNNGHQFPLEEIFVWDSIAICHSPNFFEILAGFQLKNSGFQSPVSKDTCLFQLFRVKGPSKCRKQYKLLYSTLQNPTILDLNNRLHGTSRAQLYLPLSDQPLYEPQPLVRRNISHQSSAGSGVVKTCARIYPKTVRLYSVCLCELLYNAQQAVGSQIVGTSTVRQEQ